MKEYTSELKTFIDENKLYYISDKDQYRKDKYAEEKAAIEADKRGIKVLKGTFIWTLLRPARDIYHYSKKAISYVKLHGIKELFKAVGNKLKNNNHAKKRFSKKYVKSIMPDKTEIEKQRNTKFSKNIKFSILVPLYNTPENFLREMIESVINQTYENWELCLADGSDKDHSSVGDICKEYYENNNRIIYKKLEKNLGISENTNICIKMATGEYIALFDHDDVLHPCALYENMIKICDENADFIYTDEVTFEGKELWNIVTYHFKPDFAIDNLRANNYICHFTVFKNDILGNEKVFREKYDGSQDHDLVLRLTAAASHISHIPKVLYFWRSHSNSVASDINSKVYAIEAGKNAVRDSILSYGLKAQVESSKAFPTIYRIKYEIKDKPLVSILIPNMNHIKDLARCIDSIVKKTTYDNYEIIVIENNSSEESIFKYYSLLEKLDYVRVIKWEKEFNYSAINNFAAKEAKGDYLLLLNNDTEVISASWIEEMLMFAQREDIGAVGAKLYFENDTIQHAGVIVGLGEDGIAGHSHAGEPGNSVGYMGRLYYAQDVSAVTAACLMVSKEIFFAAGGFDENFTVAYNDVDLCLKIREKGYLNVFTPEAELYHYESISRGYEDTKEKIERFNNEVALFKTKWKRILETGDKFYNKNMSLRYPWRIGPGFR